MYSDETCQPDHPMRLSSLVLTTSWQSSQGVIGRHSSVGKFLRVKTTFERIKRSVNRVPLALHFRGWYYLFRRTVQSVSLCRFPFPRFLSFLSVVIEPRHTASKFIFLSPAFNSIEFVHIMPSSKTLLNILHGLMFYPQIIRIFWYADRDLV
jgi:hypothetical protein